MEPRFELLNRHLQAENKHLMQGTLETLHAKCLFEDRAQGVVYRGREGAEDYYRTWWNAFDLKVVSERRHVTPECVISEARYQGVHKGQFLGVPATGRPIDFPLMVVISFKDGLMAGERFYYDLGTLMRQIGAKGYGGESDPTVQG